MSLSIGFQIAIGMQAQGAAGGSPPPASDNAVIFPLAFCLGAS